MLHHKGFLREVQFFDRLFFFEADNVMNGWKPHFGLNDYICLKAIGGIHYTCPSH